MRKAALLQPCSQPQTILLASQAVCPPFLGYIVRRYPHKIVQRLNVKLCRVMTQKLGSDQSFLPFTNDQIGGANRLARGACCSRLVLIRIPLSRAPPPPLCLFSLPYEALVSHVKLHTLHTRSQSLSKISVLPCVASVVLEPSTLLVDLRLSPSTTALLGTSPDCWSLNLIHPITYSWRVIQNHIVHNSGSRLR